MTNQGVSKCEIAKFSYGFSGPLQAGRGGNWDYSGKYTTAIDPNVPFGVVHMSVNYISTEDGGDGFPWRMTGRDQLILIETGTDAVSVFPESEPEG